MNESQPVPYSELKKIPYAQFLSELVDLAKTPEFLFFKKTRTGWHKDRILDELHAIVVSHTDEVNQPREVGRLYPDIPSLPNMFDQDTHLNPEQIRYFKKVIAREIVDAPTPLLGVAFSRRELDPMMVH